MFEIRVVLCVCVVAIVPCLFVFALWLISFLFVSCVYSHACAFVPHAVPIIIKGAYRKYDRLLLAFVYVLCDIFTYGYGH